MGEILLRFLIGGAVISSFALLGEVVRPKSFAGLFGAAPSIALATLGLTIAHQGKQFAAIEGRSMVLGAVAFCIYAYAVSQVLARFKLHTAIVTFSMLPIWLGVSFALRFLLLR